MTENYHRVQLVIDSGELHRAFVCTAPEDAPCRRRPPDADQRESWTDAESTVPGHQCWAVEWIEAVGIEDAIRGVSNGVLASVPVTINYDECVEITPVVAEEPEWKPEDGDTRCQECGRDNPVWWADNADWNAIMPNDGVLCPSCYHRAWLEARPVVPVKQEGAEG